MPKELDTKKANNLKFIALRSYKIIEFLEAGYTDREIMDKLSDMLVQRQLVNYYRKRLEKYD